MRKKTRLALLGASLAVAGSGISIPFAGSASASSTATVTIVNIAGSQLANGGAAHVTGAGFPSHSADPAGVQIIECSDPGGLVANLPVDPSLGCDGSTVSPSQINTSSTGTVDTHYQVTSLSTGGGSNITCDATHFCVLWVGVDYNTDFNDPTTQAFSQPFEVVSGVAPSFTSATSASFPTFGTSYSFTVTASGINAPDIAKGGALPPGVNFTNNGNGTATLSGFPTATGTYPLTLTASNGVTPNAVQSFTLYAGFVVTTTSLPNASSTSSYTALLNASGGTTPYKWKVKGLPKGLKADKTSGTISGTPILKKNTVLGPYTVTVTVTDSKLKSSKKHPNPNGHGKESATATLTLTLTS